MKLSIVFDRLLTVFLLLFLAILINYEPLGVSRDGTILRERRILRTQSFYK